MTDSDLLTLLADMQDRAADLDLLRAALAIDSVTGHETGFARFLGGEMAGLGLATGRSEFLPGRENVWGAAPGAEDRPHLMIVGHLDTVHVRGWEDHWRGDARANPFGGAAVDGQIWGRGSSDLKGGICAALAGYRLVRAAGLVPAGGVTFAFVGDEESGEPGTGVSAGAKDLVKQVAAGAIARPDFAVYVEPTRLDVYVAQIGFFIADVTVTGKSAYFGRPELGIDALKATHTILSRIWAHEAALAAGPSHDRVGTSSILVTGIDGGGYIAVPGECRFSLIRKLRPGEDLDEAVAAFERAVQGPGHGDGISVAIAYPAGRDHPKGGSPVEIDETLAPVQLLQACIRDAYPAGGQIAGAPYWSESPFLVNRIGCPAVYCAPGDIAVAHTFEERIEIEEYLAAVRSFAAFIARYLGAENKQNADTN